MELAVFLLVIFLKSTQFVPKNVPCIKLLRALEKDVFYLHLIKTVRQQKTLHDELDDFFKTAWKFDFQVVAHDYFEKNHKGHGRFERRSY